MLTEHALGVHVNQRSVDYLADIGLGYTAIKDNYLSPVEWHEASVYNSNRAPEPIKPAYEIGEAVHVHFLDGPKVYERTYAVLPTKESHPDYLDTVRELQDACARYHLSVHGLKGELIQRLVRAKAPVKILQHERDLLTKKKAKRPIAQKIDHRIRILHRMLMRSNEDIGVPGEHLNLADAMKGALTEVSIYWVDSDGIRQRARFDILKPNFTGDLKSITDWKRGDFRTTLLREIVLRGYLIQQAHYYEARQQLRIAVAEGRVFGANKTQMKKLEEIAKADAWGWLFIFAKMDGAPQVRGIVLDHENTRYLKAVDQRSQALAQHLYYREMFGGYDGLWFDRDVIWEPSDTDWPQFADFGDH